MRSWRSPLCFHCSLKTYFHISVFITELEQVFANRGKYIVKLQYFPIQNRALLKKVAFWRNAGQMLVIVIVSIIASILDLVSATLP